MQDIQQQPNSLSPSLQSQQSQQPQKDPSSLLPPLQSLQDPTQMKQEPGNTLQEVPLPSLSQELPQPQKIELPSLIPTNSIPSTNDQDALRPATNSSPSNPRAASAILAGGSLPPLNSNEPIQSDRITEKLPSLSSINFQQLPPPQSQQQQSQSQQSPQQQQQQPQIATIPTLTTQQGILSQQQTQPSAATILTQTPIPTTLPSGLLKRDNPLNDDLMNPAKRPNLTQASTVSLGQPGPYGYVTGAVDQRLQAQLPVFPKSRHASCCFYKHRSKHSADKKLFFTYPFIPYYCGGHFIDVIGRLREAVKSQILQVNPKPGTKDQCCCLCAGLYESSSIISCKNPMCHFSFCKTCVSKHIHKDSIHEPKLSQIGMNNLKS